MWVGEELAPGVYHGGFALRVRGELDVAVLRHSISEIVARHEALRTTFELGDAGLSQVIRADATIPFTISDVRASKVEELTKAVVNALAAPFDLELDLPIRVELMHLASHDHLLVVPIHHIATDGWSNQLFARELAVLYDAFLAKQPAPLAPQYIQYADFTLWQRRYVESARCLEDLAYWKHQLAGLPSLRLPTDRPRQKTLADPTAATHRLKLPASLAASVRRLRSEGVTSAILHLATFQLVLRAWTGQSDFAIGTPVANRARAEIVEMIGCVINSVVVRSDLAGDPPDRELVRRVRKTLLDAQIHSGVPFGRLVRELPAQSDMIARPLFDVFFVVEEDATPPSFGGLRVESFDPDPSRTPFDLTLHFTEHPSADVIAFHYVSTLFDAATIEGLANGYLVMLTRVVSGLAPA